MSYCIGIDSLTGNDDMDSIAANVEENLKKKSVLRHQALSGL